jgi:hypothetical protein
MFPENQEMSRQLEGQCEMFSPAHTQHKRLVHSTTVKLRFDKDELTWLFLREFYNAVVEV